MNITNQYKYFLLLLFLATVNGACPTGSTVNIPDNDNHIVPAKSYQGCSFTTAKIAEGIITIGNSAFASNSKLSSVTLPSSLEILDSAAFCQCTALKTIDIPEGVLEIFDSCFRCTGLTELVLPSTLRVLRLIALHENPALKSVSFRGSSPSSNDFFVIENNNAIYTTNHAELLMVINSVTSLTIHPATKAISSHALCFCDRFTDTEVIIPDSVTEIQDRIFYASNVVRIVLGSSIKVIDEQAFDNAMSLETIEMPLSNEHFETKDGVLYTSGLRCLIAYPANKIEDSTFTVPVETEGFMAAAFGSEYTVYITNFAVASNSQYLKSDSSLIYTKNMSVLVKVPPALSGTVRISSTATVIGSGAFYACKQVTGITFPANLLEIRDYAFGMSKVATVTFPQTLKVVGRRAFYLASPKSLDFPQHVEVIQSETCILATLTSVVIRGAKAIENAAFKHCLSLSSVTLPDTLVSIEQFAFQESVITEITLPSSLTFLGQECFAVCTLLRTIVIPFSVQIIDNLAFMSCSGLTTVTLMNCETQVSPTAFQGSPNVIISCVSTRRFTQSTDPRRTMPCVTLIYPMLYSIQP